MNQKLILILLVLLLGSNSQQFVSQVDFILGSTYTGSYLWGNIVGVSVDYNNIQNLLNNTLYQAYYLNMNVKQDWSNNWAVSVKVPLGHKYNCSAIQLNATENVTCTFQTAGNDTYWTQLGQYVWNTMNAPYWCMGYDMQAMNLTITEHQDTFYDWLYKVYLSTYRYLYCAQLVDYGDKMVQRGYKKSYTPADFISDIDMANYIVYSIAHSGPGITQDASKEWLLALQEFATVAWYGHFTVRCIVFKNPADMTIQKILSDNSTKYYLQKRFTVNSSYAYTDFSWMYTGINDIRLTTGEGVDGLTNSFAAALWALDITIQFALMNGWEIDFNFQVRQGNFQAILGPEPDLKPTALYYGLMFATLARDGSPQIVIPAMKSYISSKIKVFGLTNGDIFKVLLINKDTNTSLNGTVLVKSQLTSDMRCMYMEAPSLSETEKITIAGYNFVGGNATVNGTFRNVRIKYDYGAKGFHVPIKYAQAALCQTEDLQYVWPTSTGKKKSQSYLTFILGAIMLIMLLITF